MGSPKLSSLDRCALASLATNERVVDTHEVLVVVPGAHVQDVDIPPERIERDGHGPFAPT
jgi:hypothetical protein